MLKAFKMAIQLLRVQGKHIRSRNSVNRRKMLEEKCWKRNWEGNL